MNHSQTAEPTFRGYATERSCHAVTEPPTPSPTNLRIEHLFDSDEFMPPATRRSDYDDDRRRPKYSPTKTQKRAAGTARRARQQREAQRAGTQPAPSLRQIFARLETTEDMDQPIDLSAHRGPLPEIGHLAREKLGLDLAAWDNHHAIIRHTEVVPIPSRRQGLFIGAREQESYTLLTWDDIADMTQPGAHPTE